MANEIKEKAWYIVQTYSGKENIVRDNILSRIVTCEMQDKIFNALVPEITVIEKDSKGNDKEKIKKPYPGYVFVEMIDDDQSWWVIRNTPQVTGFLGSSGGKTRPTPMSEEEVQQVLEICGLVKPVEINFEVDDMVTITSGTYKDETGYVQSIDHEKGVAVILIELFGGQNTPVVIELKHLEKN